MQWYFAVLKKYAVFSGRARRAEYWSFALLNMLAVIALNVLEKMLGLFPDTKIQVLSLVYSVGVLLPGLGVSIRRLHDTGRSGWWMFLIFIPLIGPLVLLIFFLQGSEPGVNRFGPDPTEAGIAGDELTAAAKPTRPSDQPPSEKTIPKPQITPAVKKRFQDLGVSFVQNHQGRGVNVGFGRGAIISDRDIPALIPLNLHELYLSRTEISDASLAHFEAMPQLRVLDLSHTKLSRDGFEHLKKAIPGARIIG